MDMKELFDESKDIDTRAGDYSDDIGLKKYRSGGRRIRFMRGYSDDGELIFDPFDPKHRENSPDTPVNYNKRFSKEMKQYQKLIRQHTVYVDQLERLFRQSTGLGTSNPRQLTKTDVELANVIGQARGQLLQMIGGVGSLKKTIADLQLKQLAKLASSLGSDDPSGGDSADLRGSAVLQQIINSGMNKTSAIDTAAASNLPDINAVDDDSSLVSVDVKNENQKITLAIIHDLSTSTNRPVALNEQGEEISGYNIPYYMNDVDIYPTEMVAKSGLGHTFPLIFQGGKE